MDLTRLLEKAADGDSDAESRAMEFVYRDLCRIADRRLYGKHGARFREQTLEPVALVHETFLRLREQRNRFRNRRHFFAIATRLMMRAIGEYQRAQQTDRRGGDQIRVTLSRLEDRASERKPVDLAALEQALEQLAELAERKADVVRLYAFWGFEMSEIADMLEVSVRTVERDWAFSRVWLAEKTGR